MPQQESSSAVSNPNKHRGSSIPNGTDVLAMYATNRSDSDAAIRPDEKPSEWAKRIQENT